jgi:uncharacterized membrane protein
MTRTRLEAFSDAVIAILITIMVLELPSPHGVHLAALRPIVPVLSSYVLSFTFLAIYWNNHHHLLHLVDRVHGATLWANMHLLFWLSLVPFTTGWMGETHLAAVPTAAYGVVLLMAAVAWQVLQAVIIRHQGPSSRLAQALGGDLKGRMSAACYVAAVALAFVEPRVSAALYVVVALIWLVPDRRIERMEHTS